MKPKYQIIADDTDITALLQSRLTSITVSDEIGLVSDTLTIELDDRDMVFDVPKRGAILDVALGYDDLYPMGKFVVDEIEIKAPPQSMTITARAANSNLSEMGEFKTPKTESWDKKTIGQIIQTIAGRYGLTATVSPSYDGVMTQHTDQTDESDCAFVQRLASDYGASVKIAGGKLLFVDPLTGCWPDGTPIPPTPINSVSSYRMRITERNKYGKVTAKYYDFDGGEEKEITVGASGPVFTIRETFATEEQANLRAKAKLNEIENGTYALSVEMIGTPVLGAESVIEMLTGHPEVQGNWVIKSTRHTLNNSGYKTDIEATRPRGTT